MMIPRYDKKQHMHILLFKACYGIYSGNIDSAENDSKIQTEATIVIHVYNHSRLCNAADAPVDQREYTSSKLTLSVKLIKTASTRKDVHYSKFSHLILIKCS